MSPAVTGIAAPMAYECHRPFPNRTDSFPEKHEVETGNWSTVNGRDYGRSPFRHIAGAFLGRTMRCGDRWRNLWTPERTTRL
jgi:hypothetical protein